MRSRGGSAASPDDRAEEVGADAMFAVDIGVTGQYLPGVTGLYRHIDAVTWNVHPLQTKRDADVALLERAEPGRCPIRPGGSGRHGGRCRRSGRAERAATRGRPQTRGSLPPIPA